MTTNTEIEEKFWKALKSDLSDDDLLLKVLIPGRPARRQGAGAGEGAAGAPSGDAPAVPAASAGGPRAFLVDVDGEVFNVKISPLLGGGAAGSEAVAVDAARLAAVPEELPAGAIVAGAPGLLLSMRVGVGDLVAEGDEIAMMEIMKMRRSICSTLQGVVQEIRAHEGQMLDAGDILLVVG